MMSFQECRSGVEFERIQLDTRALEIQCLLVTQRVLGLRHPKALYMLRSLAAGSKDRDPIKAIWLYAEALARNYKLAVSEPASFEQCSTAFRILRLLRENELYVGHMKKHDTFPAVCCILNTLLNEFRDAIRSFDTNSHSSYENETIHGHFLRHVSSFLQWAAILRPNHDTELGNMAHQLKNMNIDHMLNHDGQTIIHKIVKDCCKLNPSLLKRKNGLLKPDTTLLKWVGCCPKSTALLKFLLLEAHWNPDVTDAEGRTPLHYAAHYARKYTLASPSYFTKKAAIYHAGPWIHEVCNMFFQQKCSSLQIEPSVGVGCRSGRMLVIELPI